MFWYAWPRQYGSSRNRRMVDRRVDVELLPGAPLGAVEGPDPQIIRPEPLWNVVLGQLGRGDVDVLVGALRNAADDTMATGGIASNPRTGSW